jgi:hypothetical protein
MAMVTLVTTLPWCAHSLHLLSLYCSLGKVLLFGNAFAQESAPRFLYEGNQAFQQGKYDEVLQLGSSIRSIFNMVLIAVVEAQLRNQHDTTAAIAKSPWWKKFQHKSHDL